MEDATCTTQKSCCPESSAIHILQEKWVLLIIRALLSGPKGFNELGRDVGGCNPTTLNQRLCRLEQAGIIAKEMLTDSAPRGTYTLTESGHQLDGVIKEIRSWALENLPTEYGEVPAGD